MDFLIDSHALIWYLNGDAQLSVNAHSTISNQNNRRWISPASIWEIAIKVNLGKLNLNRPLPDIQVSLSTDGFYGCPSSLNMSFKPAIYRPTTVIPSTVCSLPRPLPRAWPSLQKTQGFRFTASKLYGENFNDNLSKMIL